MRFRLLRCLARAIVKNGLKLACNLLPGVGAIYEVAADAWEELNKDQRDESLRAEVQGLAQAPIEQVRQEVQQAVEAEAADQPAEARQALTSYLTQVPSAIRRSLRRPSDPGGSTVPATLAMNRPEDLMTMLPPRPPRFQPGDRPLPGVDWELEKLVGIGGFGEVWKARHALLRSKPPVALKFCLDPSAVAALRNEAGVLDRVMQHGRHPGIVPLLQTYLSANPPCLEYELIEGGDLAGLIQEQYGRKRWTIDLANRVFLHLVDTIAHTHRANPPIVHSDLKPANVLVRRGSDGKVSLKVTDFGIGGLAAAKAIQETRKPTRSQPELVTEAVRGAYTPLYASPQQMRRRKGELADPRDDIYALGVIWYQLLTGDLGLMSIPTDWREQVEELGLSPELIPLLGTCMSSKAEKRPANAVAVAEQLRAVILEKQKLGSGVRPKQEAASTITVPPQISHQSEEPKLAGETQLKNESETERIVEIRTVRPPDRLRETGGRTESPEIGVDKTEHSPPPLPDQESQVDTALSQVESTQQEARRLAAEKHDYAAAVQLLEALPQSLRDDALFSELSEKLQLITRLDREICESIRDSQLDGLRAVVSSLLDLQPQRDDLRQLLDKLPTERAPGEVVEVLIRDNLALKFAWCPAGSFLMGSPKTETQRNEDERQRQVMILRGFWLGVTPVTQAQWQAVMGTNPSHFVEPDRPVEQVNGGECEAFCLKLGELTGKFFRLPTEPEWEYACRAGTSTPFYFGENITTEQANYNGRFPYAKGQFGIYRQQTTPVGIFPANAWGLFDMHGNVWEWCYYVYFPHQSNVVMNSKCAYGRVVIRGGSWYDKANSCRSAYRAGAAGASGFNTGCRVVYCPGGH